MSRGVLHKLRLISATLSGISSIALLAMMMLTGLDVVLRYLFRSPLLGVFEISEFLMVIIVFFSLAYTQSQDGHVAVDIFVSRLAPRKQLVIDLFNHAVTFVILLLIGWRSTVTGFELIRTMEVSGTLPIPVFPFMFVVALGCIAMGVELVQDCVRIADHYRS